jgi:hypothetical protein
MTDSKEKSSLKVLSSEIDPADVRFIRKAFLKERGAAPLPFLAAGFWTDVLYLKRRRERVSSTSDICHCLLKIIWRFSQLLAWKGEMEIMDDLLIQGFSILVETNEIYT